jgi:hypothetical protein
VSSAKSGSAGAVGEIEADFRAAEFAKKLQFRLLILLDLPVASSICATSCAFPERFRQRKERPQRPAFKGEPPVPGTRIVPQFPTPVAAFGWQNSANSRKTLGTFAASAAQ